MMDGTMLFAREGKWKEVKLGVYSGRKTMLA